MPPVAGHTKLADAVLTLQLEQNHKNKALRGPESRYRYMILSPIDRAIAHFPVALIVLAVIADVIGWLRENGAAQTVGQRVLLGEAIGVASLRQKVANGCKATTWGG
jgi:hypothetical protein